MTADEFEKRFADNAEYYTKIFSKPFFQQKIEKDKRYLQALHNIKRDKGE